MKELFYTHAYTPASEADREESKFYDPYWKLLFALSKEKPFKSSKSLGPDHLEMNRTEKKKVAYLGGKAGKHVTPGRIRGEKGLSREASAII